MTTACVGMTVRRMVSARPDAVLCGAGGVAAGVIWMLDVVAVTVGSAWPVAGVAGCMAEGAGLTGVSAAGARATGCVWKPEAAGASLAT